MGATADEVLLKIRAEGWKAAAREVKATEKAIRDAKKAADKKSANDSWLGRLGSNLKGLPAQWRAGGAGATQFRRTLSGISSDVGRLASGLAGTASSIAGIGGALTVAGGGAGLASFVKSGLELNASFEDARTSFGTLLGDMERGNKFIERLRTDISSKSPQRLTAVMGGAQTLLGQGMNEDQAVTTLSALDKAVIALGKGEEEYKLGARALGQMWANQKASLEDVNQLAEGAGINVRTTLRDKLGLTGEQVADLGNQNVSSAAALWAITSGWEEQFGEAAKNAESTWSVQVKQMVKDWEFFKRMTTEGLFKDLSKDVLPQLRKTLRNANDIMSRQDIGFSQKLRLTWSSVKADLGPLASDLQEGIADLDLDRRLQDAFSEHGPTVAAFVAETAAKGVEKGVPAAASAFWDAFRDMSAGGKVITGTALLAWLRFPFWAAGTKGAGLLAKGLWAGGKLAVGPVGARLGKTVGAQAAKSAAETAALRSMMMGDAIKARAAPGMGVAGGALGAILGAALAAKAIDEITGAITGKSISERLREGITGRDKDGRQAMPGTRSFDDAIKQTPEQMRRRGLDPQAQADWWQRMKSKSAAGASAAQADKERLAARLMERDFKLERFRPRATGGTVRPGELTLIGERGPELLRLPAGAEVTSNRQARVQAAGSRGRGDRHPVVMEAIVPVYLDGKLIYQEVRRQTELVELRR